MEIQAVPLVAASSPPTCDVRTDLTALGRPARRDVDELATKGPARISRLSGDLYFTPPAPVLSVGIVVFQNRIQDRLGRRDRLQCRQPRPAEIRPVCRLVADHCHICDRRPPQSTGYRGVELLGRSELTGRSSSGTVPLEGRRSDQQYSNFRPSDLGLRHF